MNKPRKRTAKKALKQTPPQDAGQPGPCPVVGVGASAGGLEAFMQLLKHLPKKTGLAFALVQHLDPNRKSHLSEILGRETEMPVMEAKHGMNLEPDRVYVIPPNASMSVADGTLALGARAEGRARHLPIDYFFESLAAHRGNRAIGVVLSGNASDGTIGLKAIKAAGGIAFAQEEGSAKFPGMPRSAINAGFVDFVLAPEQIAAELSRLGADPYIRAGDPVGEAHAGDGLKRIFKMLRAETNVDFAAYRQTTIERRIQRRLTVRRVNTLEEYVKTLENDPGEIQTLFRDILIHVTSFFREPESFATLAKHVFPEMVKQRPPDEAIRIWIPGCSTGEEAYSLAISLIEFLGDKSETIPIQIFGTDVADSVVEAARRGIFDASIEQDVSAARLRRFFTKVDRGYQVCKSLRSLCVFARHNIAKDPPFSQLDLVSCRNVLIYFEPALQKKLIPIFHYALKRPGWLMLGSAETIGGASDLFTPVDAKSRLFSKRALDAQPLGHLHLDEVFTTMHPAPFEPGMKRSPGVWSRLDLLKEADRVVTEKYCPPGLVLNDAMEIIQFRGEVAPYLNPGSGEASLNLFKMMRPEFAGALRTAISRARKDGSDGRRQRLKVEFRGETREVALKVLRLDPPSVGERAFVVIFEEVAPETPKPTPAKGGRPERLRSAALAEELAASQGQLQSLSEEYEATSEELRSANEEIQSSNEELQSTNEELETAKEELQSANEELTTLNEELRHTNADLAGANDDLNNLLRGVSLPVLMLGRDLCIRRFTPTAQSLFKLVPSDIGRSLGDIKAEIDVPDLETLTRKVLDGLCVEERELRDMRGRWFRLQVRPYETADNKISGVLLIFFDIDEAKRANDRLKHASHYADAIIDTVPASLLVLDGDLRVKRATPGFCSQFRIAREEVEGELLYHLGNHQWDIPALRLLLEEVLPKDSRVTNFKVEHFFPKIGKKTMVLNARRVAPTGSETPVIVLGFAEVPA